MRVRRSVLTSGSLEFAGWSMRFAPIPQSPNTAYAQRMRRVCFLGAVVLNLVGCGDDAGTTSTGGAGGDGGAVSTGGAGGSGASGTGGAGGMTTGPTGQLPPPDLGNWTGDAPIALNPSANPPGDLSHVDAAHYGDLSCGPFPENLFDILIPNNAATPMPIVIYIHGGGFIGGSRTTSFNGQQADQAEDYLNANMAYATIDYRFLDALGEGVRTSLQDSQVCLQYIRFHAATFGVDPDRVVLTGGSAGAGTSLWMGTTDDQADPGSGHPILSMSTRARGVIIDATQATYDVLDWGSVVFAPEYEGILQAALDGGQFDAVLTQFYGLPGNVDPVDHMLHDPDALAYREAVDMLEWMDVGDAPVWARTQGDDEPPLTQGIVNHHPFHVRAIIESGVAAGVEVIADVPALGLSPAESRLQFAQRVLSQ